MSEHALGADLARAEPRQFVVIEGYPAQNEESTWHVNKIMQIGSGVGDETRAYILQEADASEHWIMVVAKEVGTEWEIDQLAGFRGSPPAGVKPEDHGDAIDPASIRVLEIHNEKPE